MTSDEKRLATLLKESVPQPPTPFVFAPPVSRSRARWLAPLAAAVVVAGVAIGVVASRHDDSVPGLGPGIPTSSGSPGSGCPASEPYPSDYQRPGVSYAEVVQLFDRYYLAYRRVDHPAALRAHLGDQVGVVTCDLVDLAERRQVTGPLEDGNATGLSVGTPLYAVNGHSPLCQIAADEGGYVQTYIYRGNGRQPVTPSDCEEQVGDSSPSAFSSP